MRQFGATLLTAVMILAFGVFCQAKETGHKPPLDNERVMQDDKMIDAWLDRLAIDDPNAAAELRNLKVNNPEAFAEEIEPLIMPKPGRDEHGGPPMGRGGRGEGPSWKELKEAHDEYLKWLEKNDPEEAAKLVQLREQDAGLYLRKIGRDVRKYRYIIEAEKSNPELAKVLTEDMQLKGERNKLLAEIANAKGEEREKLVAKLEVIVSKRFDILLEKKKIRYEELNKRLEELKKELQESQEELATWEQQKDAQVQQRVEQLLDRSSDFDWQ